MATSTATVHRKRRSPTTPQKRTGRATAVTPSPCKRQKKCNDDVALRRKDVAVYLCRFRHCKSVRDPSSKKDFPAEQEIMRKLRQFASCDGEGNLTNGKEKASCSALRDFIKAYGVERNFRGMTAENVMPLLPIVKHIQALQSIERLDATLDPNAVTEQVEALADLCKQEGFARNLSFASKALNMLGHNVPIYSSECKAYLGIKNVQSYGPHLTEWMKEYEGNWEVCEDEATKLLDQQGGDEDALERELGAVWFTMRGLDQTMCRVGAPKQVQLLCPACEKLAT